MTHRVTQIENEDIILVEISDPFLGEEAVKINQEVLELMQNIELPAYRLLDFTHCSMEWSQMQQGFASQVKGTPGSMTDPNLIPVGVNVGSGAQQVAMEGFGHEPFGGLDIPLFDTLDEALAYIRNRIATKP